MALTNQTIGAGGIAGGTWTIQSTNTALVGRFHDLLFLQEGAAGSSQFSVARAGVMPSGADTGSLIPAAFVASPAGGLSISIRRGGAFVERTTSSGPYGVVVEAVGQVTLGTADAVNPRIDRVDLQVLDGALGDNGGVSLTRYVVTPGVAAGTPVINAAPINSTPIFAVTLPANTVTITSGMITDIRKSAGLRGGVRVMLPGDKLSDPGFMVGELRDTRVFGNGAPTIDQWDSVASAWSTIVDMSAGSSVVHYNSPTASVASITSTAYVAVRDASNNILAFNVFVAPASGSVWIDFGMGIHPGTGATVSVTIAVLTGGTVNSGTVITAASDNNAFASTAVGLTTPGTSRFLQTGLTPGSTYNVFVLWRTSVAVTAAGAHPYISTMPIK